MTPDQIAALQWIHDRGEVRSISGAPFSIEMLWRMERGGLVHFRSSFSAPACWSLTDEGRRALHGGYEFERRRDAVADRG